VALSPVRIETFARMRPGLARLPSERHAPARIHGEDRIRAARRPPWDFHREFRAGLFSHIGDGGIGIRKLPWRARDRDKSGMSANDPTRPYVSLPRRRHPVKPRVRTRYGMEFLAFDFGHAAAFPEKAGDELGRGLSAKEIQRLPTR
jgi:hypothetical protein